MQTTFTGTAGDNLIDESLAATSVVLRGLGGDDTLIGGAGNDRFDGGLGMDQMFGGAGNDSFFLALGRDLTGAQCDLIDGGVGVDEVIFTINAAQAASAAMKGALAALKQFLAAPNPGAHFISYVLHVDLTGVEAARVRVDGVMKTLADLLSPSLQNGLTISYAFPHEGEFVSGPDQLTDGGTVPLAGNDSYGSIRLSGGNRIDVSFASDLNWTANFDGSANFRNGFDLDTGAGDPAFAGVTIVSNGGNAGFDASHVTVSAHHIAVDWAGLSFAAGQHVTLDLLFA
jgi:hypothetical protein